MTEQSDRQNADDAHQYRLLQVSEYFRPGAEEDFGQWFTLYAGLLTPGTRALAEDLLESLQQPIVELKKPLTEPWPRPTDEMLRSLGLR